MNPLIIAFVLVAVPLTCYFPVWWRLSQVGRLPDYDTMVNDRVKNLPFVHELYVGSHQNYELFIGGKKKDIHSDTPFMVAVANDSQVIGLIGFDIENGSLLVSQLQGLKGVNLKGFNLADYLLARAEEIAAEFGLKSVKVQVAWRNIYYELDENHPLYPRLYEHQHRMRQIYDATPRARGYVSNIDRHWHVNESVT